MRGIIDRVLPPTTLINDSQTLEKPNVAGLGESLYTTHLVSIELAGILLFAALVPGRLRRQPQKGLVRRLS